MPLIKLPQDLQPILSASAQINTFKKAVEELVYNSLDAESTSIAVRVHIQDNTIQIIDNGVGIKVCDLKLVGQKYMTSKTNDLSTLKLVPKTYGYRGQALANIVAISQIVTIISRHQNNTEETWMKTFGKGGENKIIQTIKRPSKGTTVEIRGFLYNLNIQKKIVKSLDEVQNIKLFLEHISLIHSNLSLSFRDDSKNEIVFKIHKKRDIYQTLASLFDIKQTDIQELQVEKNNYKVRGLIARNEEEYSRYWIYINGRFVFSNSKLHTIVDDHFKKSLLLKNKNCQNSKSKNNIDEKHRLTKNIPSYFIFITCPYIDYDISDIPNQSIIEFKNWEAIIKLLEKLVKFYAGDINLKELSKPYQLALNNQGINNVKEDTRDQVRQIINKILGNDSKKQGVSNAHKGVKGKLIKRKIQKKKNTNTILNLPTITPKRKEKSKENNKKMLRNRDLKTCNKFNVDNNLKTKNKLVEIKAEPKRNIGKKIKRKEPCNPHSTANLLDSFSNLNKHFPQQIIKKKKIFYSNVGEKSHQNPSKHYLKTHTKTNKRLFENLLRNNNSVEERSVATTKTTNFVFKKYVKKIKHIQESIKKSHNLNHAKIKLSPEVNQHLINKYVSLKIREKPYKTTYDLVQTILKTQQEFTYANLELSEDIPFGYNSNINSNITPRYTRNVSKAPELTFDSHLWQRNNDLRTNIDTKYTLNRHNNIRFITKQSTDNFIISNERLKPKSRNKITHKAEVYKNNKMYDVGLHQTVEETTYTIELSKTQLNNNENSNRINTPNYDFSKYTPINSVNENLYGLNHDLCFGNTFTVSSFDYFKPQYRLPAKTITSKNFNDYEIFLYDSIHKDLRNNSEDDNLFKPTDQDNTDNEKNRNIVFVSKSQTYMELTNTCNINPLHICETILDDRNETQIMSNFDTNNRPNDCLFQNVTNVEENPNQGSACVDIMENVSHHFSNFTQINNLEQQSVANVGEDNKHDSIQKRQLEAQENNNVSNMDVVVSHKMTEETSTSNNYNLRNRLRFLPKGMSQIFSLCNSKSACDYNNVDEDYFENSIYNHFAKEVQVNAETYEPVIQSVKEFTTTNMQKVNDRLNKENASLVFDGESLKEAKVLGQIDSKFIAAIIKEKYNQRQDLKEYLVLFDQHAVHERIRLENNLSDYFDGVQWRSVPLDSIVLNFSKDHVLYLNNYEEKFNQLGLQWTILGSTEISIHAIPKAILGKNPREVENVIKAVRNLIIEEINIMKMQKGCLSLYPKSIMDLVFSEACRYAIKFGDKLSKSDCKELLEAQSACKTPFQCAHGRPVIAVLMDIENEKREYKINFMKLKEFQLRRTNNKYK